MHFSETDQIYSKADCEKSNGQILSQQVSNKILRISASFELRDLIVAHLVLEIFKNKTRPVSKNHPVLLAATGANVIGPHSALQIYRLVVIPIKGLME